MNFFNYRKSTGPPKCKRVHSCCKLQLIHVEVDEGIRQLASVNMDHLNTGQMEADNVKRVAPDFTSMYTSLLNVMAIRETKQRARKAQQASQVSSIPSSSNMTTTSLKRPSDSQEYAGDAKRVRTGNTPDRPTKPVDATFSNTTDKSGNSIEFKDEEHTKELITLLLMNTMSVLESEFRRIEWQQSGRRVELCQTSVLSHIVLTHSKSDHATFKLGVETVTAINDGGLGIQYHTGRKWVRWRPHGIRPVLSIEVHFHITAC